MKDSNPLAMLAFPVIAFGSLDLAGVPPVVSAVFVSMLTFRREIASALRTRRVSVRFPWFAGSIDGPPASDPEEPGG